MVVKAELPETCKSKAGKGGDEPDTKLLDTSDFIYIQLSLCTTIHIEHISA